MAKGPRNSKMKASPKAKTIAQGYKDKRSRPGLYYGTDGLKKITLPSGEVRWVEKDVHPTRT
tara:strand:+ start:563 stop:748 length:186 start_codon:yes stop_codon:yes gene_type:complete